MWWRRFFLHAGRNCPKSPPHDFGRGGSRPPGAMPKQKRRRRSCIWRCGGTGIPPLVRKIGALRAVALASRPEVAIHRRVASLRPAFKEAWTFGAGLSFFFPRGAVANRFGAMNALKRIFGQDETF